MKTMLYYENETMKTTLNTHSLRPNKKTKIGCFTNSTDPVWVFDPVLRKKSDPILYVYLKCCTLSVCDMFSVMSWSVIHRRVVKKKILTY